MLQRASSLSEVISVLRTRGDRRYDGEPVSHREHALQCASLAERAGAPPALVVACLLHDIGHLLGGGFGEGHDPVTPTIAGIDDRHEVIGAAWLGALMPPAVLQPIRWHVEAKRYLVATRAAYRENLSADSLRSLALQGGPMDSHERSQFVARPFAQDALALRVFDDAAKQPGAATLSMELLARRMEACVRAG